MTIAIVHRPLPLIGRLSSPMAVVLQHCKGAGAAEDDDRRCHHGDRLLPIMWSIDSSLYSASRLFESAEPSQTASVQLCLPPRHRSQAYRRQSVHMLKCRRDGCWFKGRNHPTITPWIGAGRLCGAQLASRIGSCEV